VSHIITFYICIFLSILSWRDRLLSRAQGGPGGKYRSLADMNLANPEVYIKELLEHPRLLKELEFHDPELAAAVKEQNVVKCRTVQMKRRMQVRQTSSTQPCPPLLQGRDSCPCLFMSQLTSDAPCLWSRARRHGWTSRRRWQRWRPTRSM
jgi:hypothetical protein